RAIGLAAAALSQDDSLGIEGGAEPTLEFSAMISISSDAIDERGNFDPRYTCDFDNSSPELRWDGVGPDAAVFVVIAEDPDAPGGLFTHWLIYNISANL